MKKNKLILFILLTLFPSLVFAGSKDSSFPLSAAIMMELFVSIHMSIFVLIPLAKLSDKDNYKKIFSKYFLIRAAVLIFFDLFITPAVAILDFFVVFIGAIVVGVIAKSKSNSDVLVVNNLAKTISSSDIQKPVVSNNGIKLNCVTCGSELKVTDKFCGNCGTSFSGNNVAVSTTSISTVSYQSFDPIYRLSEDEMVESFIKKELEKAQVDEQLMPMEILRRRKIFNFIFSLLLFIYVCLIFFHFPVVTYVIGLVLLFIFFILIRKFNIIKYLKKQIKARPGEKISNIVMSMKANSTVNNSKKIFVISVLIAVILPMVIFINPVILYEKVDNGYAVRYYAFGLTNFKTATIPETHKGKKVVSLRGNTFSNMFFLESVTLPDTITEIRGQAFKNTKIKEIKLPKNLTYLGGGAFYNCKHLKYIEIPDGVTYIGGEAFYNAVSLENVKLSNNITEIRGNTFENCSSLKSIVIPDSVTRIGGHAFYGCSNLSEVTITKDSKLGNIGSSAFRRCSDLYYINLPKGVSYGSRSFKESPTKIKVNGDLSTNSFVESDRYSNNNYIYVELNHSEKINIYNNDSKIKDGYIILEKVNVNNKLSEFILTYKDSKQEVTFTLTKSQPYKMINENVAIGIPQDYIFERVSGVLLNVYYN